MALDWSELKAHVDNILKVDITKRTEKPAFLLFQQCFEKPTSYFLRQRTVWYKVNFLPNDKIEGICRQQNEYDRKTEICLAKG